MSTTDLARLERQLAREREARKQVERLLEQKSRELYEANLELTGAVNAFEASSSRLYAILDHSFAGILVSDEQNGIIILNRAAKAMFRLGAASVSSLSMLDLFAEASRTSCMEAATSYIGSDDASGREVWHHAVGQRPDGEVFPLEFIVTDLELSEDHHRVWIFRDLTQQRAAEAERQALEDNLRQAQKLEALGTMAGGVAHEINTPIQYVGSNINYLRDGMEDLLSVLRGYRDLARMAEGHHEFTAMLERLRRLECEADFNFLIDEIPDAISQASEGLERVSKIVLAVKQFAHPSHQQRQPFDVNQAIESTIEVAGGQWKYVADLETDLGDDLPELSGHLGEFNQVVLNLIVNAAQAIEASGSGQKGLIRVRTKFDNNTLSVDISDDGCGIPASIQERIFEPFFTTKDVGKGSGQGLALCYRIVTQSFNGAIRVVSDDGQGACFTLEFPVDSSTHQGPSLNAGLHTEV